MGGFSFFLYLLKINNFKKTFYKFYTMNMNFFYKLDIVPDKLDMFKEKEMYYVHLHQTPWWNHLRQRLVKVLSHKIPAVSAPAHASLPGHCSNENFFTMTN